MMDNIDRLIINRLQGGFPIADRPYAAAATAIGIDEADLVRRLERMLADGTLSRFGPLYDAERMGGAVTLAAMAVPAERFDEVAAIVNGFPEVAHNYARDHRLNMWFVVNADEPERIAHVLAAIEQATGLPVMNLPKRAEYFLELRLQA
jgi:DNA-binding Lrp family transcriptional regulator